ncbi:hypothetical protein Acr_00g0026440 [Actinidia rufa]|uniref:Uncharacterized protein n=1 Tax=Actinidia rufa TaxID=165716 RepID=A0A7J0DDS0_9ERIC|nr:hypothetical protein Acr_00g0026440 [Actinidia rufa]
MANRYNVYKHSSKLQMAQKKGNTAESKKAKAALAIEVKKHEANDDLAAKSFIEELDTPVEHPSWNAAAPEVEVPDPPKTYSPILLLDYNEEEYVCNDPPNARGLHVSPGGGAPF